MGIWKITELKTTNYFLNFLIYKINWNVKLHEKLEVKNFKTLFNSLIGNQMFLMS